MDDISRINKSMAFIKKIVEYDQNNNTELMNTLEVYYGSNFSLKETACKLFLHYNSISYRLKKISEITNVDITTSDGMFTLIVGMKLKKLL
jgi:DNA-binding PucR family transcriptional regulator